MLSKQDVQKIASLARLSLTDDEVEFYQKALGRVLGHIEKLQEVKSDHFSEGAHVPEDALKQRSDEEAAFSNNEGLLSNAPDVMGRMFILPPVLEE